MGATHKILIVDDEPDIREIVHLVLELEGFEVYELDNGKAVLDTVQAIHPDAILLDVLLGDSDGREVCKQLKANKATTAIPVLILSATHGVFNANTRNYGANDCISKPFDIADLVSRIRRQLRPVV